jgi:hypothetical protein
MTAACPAMAAATRSSVGVLVVREAGPGRWRLRYDDGEEESVLCPVLLPDPAGGPRRRGGGAGDGGEMRVGAGAGALQVRQRRTRGGEAAGRRARREQSR